jgi:hypothetical protein
MKGSPLEKAFRKLPDGDPRAPLEEGPDPLILTTLEAFGGGRLVIAEHAHGARLWDVVSGEERFRFGGERLFARLGGDMRILLKRGESLVMRELPSCAPGWEKVLDKDAILHILTSARALLCASKVGYVVLDFDTGELLREGEESHVSSLEGRYLRLPAPYGGILIVEARTGRQVVSLGAWPSVVALSSDERWLLRSNGFFSLELWEVAGPRLVTTVDFEGRFSSMIENPLGFCSFESLSPQSGNTDTDTTWTYELPSGKLLSSVSEDVPSWGGYDDTRVELGHGVVRQGLTLSTDGTSVEITSDDHIHVEPEGTVYVVRAVRGKEQLQRFVLERARSV